MPNPNLQYAIHQVSNPTDATPTSITPANISGSAPDDLLLASAVDIRADMDIVSAGGTLTAYDQSGYGRDFSRVTATAPVLVASDPLLGGAPSLQFDGTLSQRLTTSAVLGSTQTFSIFVAGWFHDPDPSGLIPGHTGYIFDTQIGRTVVTTYPSIQSYDGAFDSTNSGFEGKQIIRWEFNASTTQVKAYRNGALLGTFTYTPRALGSAGTASIGSSYDGSVPYFTGSLNRFLIVPGILSPTRAAAIERIMAARIGLTYGFVLTKTIGGVGNSIGSGMDCSMTLAARLKQRLGLTGTAYSGAISGESLTQMIASPSTQLAGIPTNVDFLVICELINDLSTTQNPGNTAANLLTYINIVRARGYTGRIIVTMPTPRDNGGYTRWEADRQTLIGILANMQLPAGVSLVRIDQDSRIGAPNSNLDGTYYANDAGAHVHPNDTGQTVMANLIARDLYAANYLAA